MKTSARIRLFGPITSIKEYVSVASGKKSLQVIIADGAGTAYRADVYDEALYQEALHLPTGTNAIITGRLTGKVNDRGYFSYSIFADEIIPYHAAPKSSAPTTPPPPSPNTLADEDIPF